MILSGACSVQHTHRVCTPVWNSVVSARDPFRDKAFFQLQTREEQAQWLGWVSARARENNFLNNNPHQPKGSQ